MNERKNIREYLINLSQDELITIHKFTTFRIELIKTNRNYKNIRYYDYHKVLELTIHQLLLEELIT
jgi:hypothetical protein